MYTLGINATCHDSSACLVRDGHVVAATYLSYDGYACRAA